MTYNVYATMYRTGLALTLNVVNKHIYVYIDLVQM